MVGVTIRSLARAGALDALLAQPRNDAGLGGFLRRRLARRAPKAPRGVGRFLLGFVVDRVGPDRLLRLGTLASLLGSALFAAGSPGSGPSGS
jgi:hypothetical protein